MLLLLRAAEVYRLRGERREQEDQRAGVVVLRGLFDGQGKGQEACAGATVLLRNREAEEARLREYLEDVLGVLAALVELGGAWGNLLAGDAPGGIADQLV